MIALLEAATERPARERISYARVESPLGPLFLATTARGLCWLALSGSEEEVLVQVSRQWPAAEIEPHPAALQEASRQLAEYFSGRRTRFALPVDLSGLTPFQQAVLEVVAEIPFGRTLSYAEVAAAVGRPRAYRAAGNAVGCNPVSIVIPCHRVLRSGGRLGGYAYGLDYKRALLRLEGIEVDSAALLA